MRVLKMNELMLKVENVSKEYRLGTIGGGTLKGEIQSRIARFMKKEDPNLKIGEKAHNKNERFLALDDVSFSIKKGERIGIIGHNGAGKSTILKLICRVTAPSQGNIYLNGRITSMLEVGTGFHNELTGKENIYLNGAILGMSKSEIDTLYTDIVEFSEVGQFINTPVKRYSSGMKVKLGFAVASHLNSEIMIMDEVLAVGDMAFQRKCLDRMRQVAEEDGRTILYVSHNMQTIRTLCNRCIVLDHGKVVFDGDVEKAISIYMNDEANSDTKIDYTHIPRRAWLRDTHIKTTYTEFINKNDNIFSENDYLDLKINWLNEKKITDLGLRVEVKDETRNPIATALFYDFYSGEKDENGSIRVKIPLGNLVCGTYTTNYVFFLKDQVGQNIDVDCVSGLCFEIRKNKEIIWNSKAWGYMEITGNEILEVN